MVTRFDRRWIGVGTAEDNLRVYFARNLRQPDSGFVVSARLQRPF